MNSNLDKLLQRALAQLTLNSHIHGRERKSDPDMELPKKNVNMRILKVKPARDEANKINSHCMIKCYLSCFFFFAARPATELQSAMQEKLCECEVVKEANAKKDAI